MVLVQHPELNAIKYAKPDDNVLSWFPETMSFVTIDEWKASVEDYQPPPPMSGCIPIRVHHPSIGYFELKKHKDKYYTVIDVPVDDKVYEVVVQIPNQKAIELMGLENPK